MTAYILPIEKPEKMVQIHVTRYNPEVDTRPEIQTYTLPFVSTMTVMQALEYLWDQGEYIAFRSNCREFTCGSCAILINGEPRLACMTVLQDGMKLEPLSLFPTLRDLVVDQTKLLKKYSNLRLWPDNPRICFDDFRVSPQTIKRYSDIYSRCVECYCCLESCPSVAVDWESYAGPMLMIQLARVSEHPLDQEDRLKMALANGLYLCTTCKKCEEVCPLSLSCPRDVTERFRAQVVERGIGLLEGHQEVMHRIRESGKYTTAKGRSFLETVREEESVVNPVDRVAFFVGCLADLHLQDSATAMVDILKRNRVEVVTPKEQICCGSPLIRIGEVGLAEELVLKNVDILEHLGVKRVVTLCAHCAFTMREDWAKILEKKRGKLPNFEILDISAYLTREIQINTEDLKPLKMSVTYHDPCYLNRGLDVSKEPRELLKKIPGVRFIEMENSDRCCGGGGEVKDGAPQFARAITSVKIESIQKTAAEAVVTVCPHCVEQIVEVSAACGISYHCVNIVELLSRSYQG